MTQFTRNVRFDIKRGKSQEIKNVMEHEILPVLKKQGGFRGEHALVNENHAVGISCWDTEKSADAYRKDTYPRVLEMLTPVINGAASIETYDLASTTFQS